MRALQHRFYWAVEGHWGALAKGWSLTRRSAKYELEKAVRRIGKASIYSAGILEWTGWGWMPIRIADIYPPYCSNGNKDYRPEADPTTKEDQQ